MDDEAAVVGAHAGECTGEAAAPAWATPAGAGRGFDRLILVEALDRPSAARALARLRTTGRLAHLPADFGADVYDLAFAFPGHDARERERHRRKGWSG
jgi:hypothetical protein